MNAAEALARAEAAGVRLRLRPDRGVRMEAAAPPSAGVLADLRQYREAVVALLLERELAAVAPFFKEMTNEARPPSWSDALDLPAPGAWCGCCGRHSRSGGRWWCEAVNPSGWCCCTCHPAPPGLTILTRET